MAQTTKSFKVAKNAFTHMQMIDMHMTGAFLSLSAYLGLILEFQTRKVKIRGCVFCIFGVYY